MAITVVGTSAHIAASASPAVATFAAPVSGNTLVVIMVATTAVNLAVATPSGWTVGRAGASGSVYCFWKISDGTETSINFTFTPGALRMNCIQLAGADASTPFDTSGVAEGVASTNSVATVTDAAMAVNDEYAIAMAGQSATNNDTETATNSFTTVNTGNARDTAAQRIYSGTGGGVTASTTLGWTTAAAARWIIAAFKPAGGVPAGVPGDRRRFPAIPQIGFQHHSPI